MSRRNEGKTNFSKLKSDREKYLKDSKSRLFQLKICLDVLKEAEVDHDLIQKLYDREKARNIRLTKLLEEIKN